MSAERTPSKASGQALIFAVFFASGMAGLIYQVAWSRLLTLLVGVSIFAITAVICTFMIGLALGSYLIGRWGDRWRDPLIAYGIIEGAIGIYALLTPWIFSAIQPAYVWGFDSLGRFGLNALRVLLSGGVLLLPTALMGGTLPLLSRAVAARSGQAATGSGLLYAVNTFGAMTGCVVAGFVLLPEYGVRASLFMAAAINLVIAVVVIAVRWRASEDVPIAERAPVRTDGDASADTRLLMVVFFVSGFAALGYEVLWTRALMIYLKASTYAFSLMLAVYLCGIAAGSLLTASIAQRSKRPLLGLALCQFGVAAGAVFGIWLFPDLAGISMRLLGIDRLKDFGDAVALMFCQAGLILLLPTLFMGAMFPFGIAAYHRQSRGIAESVGSLYAVNTAGNILGSIFVGFFAIEMFGVRTSLIALVGVNLFLCAAILYRLTPQRGVAVLWPAMAAIALVVLDARVSERLLYDKITFPGNNILFYREGASDTIAVVERPKEKDRNLIYGDGRGAAATSTVHWNMYFGHLPMVLHPRPKEALHICYGSGNSVRALTRHDPTRVDVVELSPHVRDASPFFWTNEGVIDDPRVHLIVEDGRNFVLGTQNQYDVISLEPPSIYTAGVVNLYTEEFYELCRRRLRPDGLMVQWVPTSELTEDARGRMIRAFANAFPHVSVWQQLQSSSILLLGGSQPLAVDVEEVDRRLHSEAMRKDMATMGLQDAYGFLSLYLLSDADTRKIAAPYEPVRDDRTVIDYSIPKFVGAGFGFGPFAYGLGEDPDELTRIVFDRLKEYAQWHSPASTIVADPAQARLLDEAIRMRMTRPVTEINRETVTRRLDEAAAAAAAR